MQTTHRLAIIFLLIGALALPTAVPFAYAQSTGTVVDAEVIITASDPTTCGVSTSPASLNFGSLTDGQDSERQSLTVINTGTSQSDIYVRGTDWTTTTSPINIVMPASATLFSPTPGGSLSLLPHTSITPSLLGTIAGGANMDSDWLLRVALADPSFSGNAVQNILVISLC